MNRLLDALFVFGFCSALSAACAAPSASGPASSDALLLTTQERQQVYAAYIEAELQQRAGDLVRARELYTTVLDIDRRGWLPWLRYAEVQEQLGSLDDALEAALESHKRGAPPERATVLAARALIALERADEALELLALTEHESVDEVPGIVFYITWAEAALEHGTDDLLLEVTDRWANAYFDSPHAIRRAADVRRRAGLDADAAEFFELAAALPDGHGTDWQRAARIRAELGQDEEARSNIDTCLRDYADDIGCVLFDLELRHGAGESIEEAIENLALRLANRRDVFWSFGVQVLELVGSEAAVALARSVADRRPRDVAIIELGAWLSHRAGESDASIELMERVLALDPQNAEALNFIGYTWADEDRNLEQAEVYLLEANRLRPGDANILDSVGWLYFRMGRLDEAEQWLRDAIDADNEIATLHKHLGDVLWEQGAWEEAREAWRRALELEDDEEKQDVLKERIERPEPQPGA